MSQFSILGKFYVSMALILSLVSGFCEGRNVSEPSLNSFCPLNPLFPTSTHVEQNVTSCLESCTEFLCTSVFSSLSVFLVTFHRGKLTMQGGSTCSFNRSLIRYLWPRSWLILIAQIQEIFSQSSSYLLFVSGFLKCHSQPDFRSEVKKPFM